MTEKIGLQAVLDTSDFAAGTKTYNSGIDAMEASNEGFSESTDDVTEGLEAVDDAAATTGKSAVELAAQMELVTAAYDAVAAAVGEAIELADLGSQANRAEERFRSFAGEVGNADELFAAFNKGAGGTVDKLTAMTSAGRLLQMGLVGNNQEMEQVVEMATRLGDQTQSAGDRVADFAALLANQSIPRLDNFGISSGKVRTRIAELQAAFPGMSREVAFSKAVFEQGAVSLDILGVRTQDAGAKMEVARANIQNMRIEMGQRLLPIVASVFGVIANLNMGTLALIATLSGGTGAVLKFGGGLSGLAEKSAFGAKGLGALALATTALVIALERAQDQWTALNAAQSAAQNNASAVADGLQDLVVGGDAWSTELESIATKLETAKEKYDSLSGPAKLLAETMGADTEAAVIMGTALSALDSELQEGSASYAQYIESVNAANVSLADSGQQIVAVDQAYFKMHQGIRESQETWDNLSASQQANQLTIASQIASVDGLTWAEIEQKAALEDTATATAELVISEDTRTRAIKDATLGIEGLNAADTAGIEVRTAAKSTAEGLAAAEAQRASIVEKVARVEDMQATSALAATAALEAKREKDIAVVQAEQALAQSVMNASDAMIAQSFITGLDPEAMGLTAYRDAVEDIQLAFGLATPESIALAQGIGQGIDAINAGDVARDDMSGFINAIIDDSKDATSSFDGLSREFASSSAESERLAGRIDDTGQAIMNNVAATEDLIAAEEGLDSTTSAIGDTMVELTDLTANVADENETWLDTISMTDRTISDTQVTTEQWADKMQGLGTRLAGTGEDALTTGQKIDGINSALERTDDAGADAASGLDAVTESSGETAAALEESTTAVGGLETAMSEAAAAAPGHGAAIGSGLRAGMEPQMDGFVASFRDKLQSLKDQLPSSEPKDSTSPLYGLGESGEAIVGNITLGIEAAGPTAVDAMAAVGESMGDALVDALRNAAGVVSDVLDIDETVFDAPTGPLNQLVQDLFGAAGTIGSLGGAAGAIFQREVIAPLEERRKGFESAFKEMQKDREKQEKSIEKMADGFEESTLSLIRGRVDILGVEGGLRELDRLFGDEEFERVMALVLAEDELNQMLERRNALQEKSVANTQKLQAEQERLNKLQQQQENLRFLEQQADLLQLIAEKGLDAGAILGGLQLGIDADAGLVMDAMAAAMQQIIAQAEEELGIASPSKVFEQIGRNAMRGMAFGIEELMNLPVAQAALATQSMVAAPAAIASQGGGTDNSVNFGDFNFSGVDPSNMGQARQFSTAIIRDVKDSMRGVS